MGSVTPMDGSRNQLRAHQPSQMQPRAPLANDLHGRQLEANLTVESRWPRSGRQMAQVMVSQRSSYPNGHAPSYPDVQSTSTRGEISIKTHRMAVGADGLGAPLQDAQSQYSSTHQPSMQPVSFAHSYPATTGIPQAQAATDPYGGSHAGTHSTHPSQPAPSTAVYPTSAHFYSNRSSTRASSHTASQSMTRPMLEERVLRPPPSSLLPLPARSSGPGSTGSITHLVDRLVSETELQKRRTHRHSIARAPTHRDDLQVTQGEYGQARNPRETPPSQEWVEERSVHKERKKRKRDDSPLDIRGDGAYALRKRVKRSVAGIEYYGRGDDEEYVEPSESTDGNTSACESALEAAAVLLSAQRRSSGVEGPNPPLKRRRGRPRVYPPGQSPSALKRKMYKGTGRPRGRPRKHPKKEEE